MKRQEQKIQTFIASQQKHDIKSNMPNNYNINYIYYARQTDQKKETTSSRKP